MALVLSDGVNTYDPGVRSAPGPGATSGLESSLSSTGLTSTNGGLTTTGTGGGRCNPDATGGTGSTGCSNDGSGTDGGQTTGGTDGGSQIFVARPDTYDAGFGEALTLDVMENDSFPAGSWISTFTQPDHGTVSLVYGGAHPMFAYTPDAGFFGTDGFNYEIYDSSVFLFSTGTTVSVTVAPPACPALDFVTEVAAISARLEKDLKTVNRDIGHLEMLIERFDPGIWTQNGYMVALAAEQFIDAATRIAGTANPYYGALFSAATAIRDGARTYREQDGSAAAWAVTKSATFSVLENGVGAIAGYATGEKKIGLLLQVIRETGTVLYDETSGKNNERSEAIKAVGELRGYVSELRLELQGLQAEQHRMVTAITALRTEIGRLDCGDYESWRLKSAIDAAGAGTSEKVALVPGSDTGPRSVTTLKLAPDDGGMLKGSLGQDFLVGGASADKLKGLAGDDQMIGGEGRDRLVGGRGNDGLSGGAGADRLQGNDGRDTLAGNSGKDSLFGGKHKDLLSGGGGKDKINGGGGPDRLDGGGGNDVLVGGKGADSFVFSKGKDVIRDMEQRDTLELSGALLKKGADLADYARTDQNGLTLDFGRHELHLEGVTDPGQLGHVVIF